MFHFDQRKHFCTGNVHVSVQYIMIIYFKTDQSINFSRRV